LAAASRRPTKRSIGWAAQAGLAGAGQPREPKWDSTLTGAHRLMDSLYVPHVSNTTTAEAAAMIKPMTTATQQTSSLRWALPFLAALVALLATLVSTASASAATTPGNETRVRAFAVVADVSVHPPEHIAAGQRLGNDPAGVATAVATGVAAKTGTELRKVGDVLESVDDVMANPSLLAGRHPALVENILKDTPGWQVEKLGRGSQAGRGWVFRQYTNAGNPTGLQLRWHPGGGHHGPDPYWRVVGPNGDLGGIIR